MLSEEIYRRAWIDRCYGNQATYFLRNLSGSYTDPRSSVTGGLLRTRQLFQIGLERRGMRRQDGVVSSGGAPNFWSGAFTSRCPYMKLRRHLRGR